MPEDDCEEPEADGVGWFDAIGFGASAQAANNKAENKIAMKRRLALTKLNFIKLLRCASALAGGLGR